MSQLKILTFIAHYLPGYKSGGPVRTIANLVDRLGDEFDFWIVTSDRDPLDAGPYATVEVNAWNSVGKAKVYYASPDFLRLGKISRLIRETPHDVLYLNSFFNAKFTALPLLSKRFGRLPDKPIVLAPRGEFSAGALILKSWKKIPYFMVAKTFGLYRGIIWQASSVHEANDIQKKLGFVKRSITIAPDLSSPIRDSNQLISENNSRKRGDPLRVLFLSRITPMKNLDFALKVMAEVSVPVEFNIYGPVRDETYWLYCKGLLSNLPPNIKAEYKGSVSPKDVPEIMVGHDLFFLPTMGENYGHVIPEALSVGTPVLIADTTPWRNLEKAGIGWDIPLNKKDGFLECIHRCFHLNENDYGILREKVKHYAMELLADPKLTESNRNLFLQAAGCMKNATK